MNYYLNVYWGRGRSFWRKNDSACNSFVTIMIKAENLMMKVLSLVTIFVPCLRLTTCHQMSAAMHALAMWCGWYHVTSVIIIPTSRQNHRSVTPVWWDQGLTPCCDTDQQRNSEIKREICDNANIQTLECCINVSRLIGGLIYFPIPLFFTRVYLSFQLNVQNLRSFSLF